MTDRVKIICSHCRKSFSERAHKMKPGYQTQCTHCMKLITFDSSSEDPNIRLTYVSNGAKHFRAEARDTQGHVFEHVWDVDQSGM